MKLVLVGIVLWLIASTFLTLLVGTTFWLLRKFSPLRNADGSEWARLTALGLLVPPGSGVALAIAGLTSALLCPTTSVRNWHLCLHSARHLCGHASVAAIGKSHFLLWGAAVWFGLVSASVVLLWGRTRATKRFQPSPKLKQAIALAKLPSDLPVWESDDNAPAGLSGVISPSIFVSRQTVRRLPISALTVVLRHEYAHFARRDHWPRWLLFAITLIFAPIPFVVWLQQEWRFACEKAADDFAASNRKSARLLDATLSAVQDFAGFGNDQLQHRIERLNLKRLKDARANLIGAGAILAGLALGAFIFHVPAVWLTFHCLAEALILK